MITRPMTKDILRAKISASSSGDNTIVSAVSDKRIRVLKVILMSAGTVNATFQSGAGGTALTGAMPLIANIGFDSGYCPPEAGQFETGVGELLNLSLSGAVGTFGWLIYVLEGGNNS